MMFLWCSYDFSYDFWVANASNNQYLWNLFYSVWSDGGLHHDSFVQNLCFFRPNHGVPPMDPMFASVPPPPDAPEISSWQNPKSESRVFSEYRSCRSQVPELQKAEIPSSGFCHGPEPGIAALSLKYRRCRGSFPELQNPESRARGFVVAPTSVFRAFIMVIGISINCHKFPNFFWRFAEICVVVACSASLKDGYQL